MPTSKPRPTTLLLVRHGETEGNVARVLQGHMPGRLTPRGHQQAHDLGLRLAADGLRPDILLSSDLARAMQTAEHLATALHLPVRTCRLLRERDWGELTGAPQPTERPLHFPPSVETVEAMQARAALFLRRVRVEAEGRVVLVVTHGLFARCVQAVAAGVELSAVPRMDNVELRRVDLSATLSATSAPLGADVAADS